MGAFFWSGNCGLPEHGLSLSIAMGPSSLFLGVSVYLIVPKCSKKRSGLLRASSSLTQY